jgi:hypothetical protein
MKIISLTGVTLGSSYRTLRQILSDASIALGGADVVQIISAYNSSGVQGPPFAAKVGSGTAQYFLNTLIGAVDFDNVSILLNGGAVSVILYKNDIPGYGLFQ